MAEPAVIKPHLDRLLERFDKSFLEPDPLAAIDHFQSTDDLETAGLFAAMFAYGRADLIQRNVASIVSSMTPGPARFIDAFEPAQNREWMRGFAYRFHKRDDLVALALAVKNARRKHGSLLRLFLEKDDPASDTILPGLSGMAHALREYAGREVSTFKHLLSNPSAGGACKRWALYLRWMVRKDNVDPGPWSADVSKARLVIPLDIHVGRIARRLGILKRKSSDWKAVMELTGYLKKLDPQDPVKYDFAICSYGKLGYCASKTDITHCAVCDMTPICSDAP